MGPRYVSIQMSSNPVSDKFEGIFVKYRRYEPCQEGNDTWKRRLHYTVSNNRITGLLQTRPRPYKDRTVPDSPYNRGEPNYNFLSDI